MKKSKKSDERRPEEKEDFKFSYFITRDIALKFSKTTKHSEANSCDPIET